MKIRTGFVSNSSSTSFCIMGTVVDHDTYRKLEDKIYDAGLDTHDLNQYDDDMVVGLNFSDMSGDETKNQFIERVTKILIEVFGGDPEVHLHEGGWYDG